MIIFRSDAPECLCCGGDLQSVEIISLLEKELTDNDRWMCEVMTDYQIPFDDHKSGRRLAFTQWMCDRQSEIKKLQSQVEELQRQVGFKDQSLAKKNRELDALHYVWCSGGCNDGVHRWQDAPITEELVLEAERNIHKLRTWWDNHLSKTSSTDS